jgi:hypothetical protein
MKLLLYDRTAYDNNFEAEAAAFARRCRRFSLRPFTVGDTSTGMEYELQVAVEGEHNAVDLPMSIRESSFFRNTVKRAARGDLPKWSIDSLRDFLYHNDSQVWENSWVRLPEDRLCDYARKQLSHDLLADKSCPDGPQRQDIDRFSVTVKGRTWRRLPISYLLKLALADAIGSSPSISPVIFKTGRDLLPHFLSDNTSPEILSFTIPVATDGQVGRAAAHETARSFLFNQILVQYANSCLGLQESGQKCLLYNAPHAPYRQKKLNEIVPDGFYRHLFMSPCLSGWDRGEEKHQYMALCHRTLSRSQLNTIGKLKDAGIITNNLVTLPNTSNTCLANNGTHVSLGSRLLTGMAAETGSGFSPGVEKYLGDLVIKIVEHFLPLFVTTYTAAPYRIDFADFHPEKVLGFLPHELDYTHLRMLWRRWQKKAGLGFLGHTVTPFGPRAFDTLLARCLGLHGDLVPDFRLIDYLVTLLSTESSPALDGLVGNQLRLRQELADLGVFDERMAMYLPYRQREFGTIGFAGFEGRSYSLFPSLLGDMARAVDLQNLVTALAYQYLIEERVGHRDIPDQPSVESERRQIFFAAAIGIPTFFVRADTPNRFLRRILSRVRNQRNSRRYKGYIRIKIDEYRLALLEVIEQDGRKLIGELGLAETIEDLRHRLTDPGATALDRLVTGTKQAGGSRKKPHRQPADSFNSANELYYRTTLRRQHTGEGLTVLAEDCDRLEKAGDPHLRQVLAGLGRDCPGSDYIREQTGALLDETASSEILQSLLHICLAVVHAERRLNP